jgi:hypothetical protein
MFMQQSGLAGVRPDAPIRVSRAVGYLELLENVQIHGYHLMRAAGRALFPTEIARDWYERVYQPAVDAIRRRGTDKPWPRVTEADLFLCAYQRRRDLVIDSGCMPLEAAAREWNPAAEKGRRRGGWRLLGGPRS